MMVMTGTHDSLLVGLSILIAIFSSFTALSLATRIRASRGWMRRVWLSAAAAALGGGIWSMHFVAMLAFGMPGMRTSYDLDLTLLSLAVAIGFTGGGFAIMNWHAISRLRIVAAGLLMGFGVVAMHYIGMAAMRMPATLRYERLWVAVSALVAVGAATAAVWLASRDRKTGHRLAAAAVMGAAISGMHYSAMRAAVFTAAPSVDMAGGLASVGQANLAIVVSATTGVILLLALGAAGLERLFHGLMRREARAALRLEVADIMRGGNAQDALQEVAALMGRHFGVSRTGYAQLDPAQEMFDYQLCWTDGTVPPLLGRFPTADFEPRFVAALNAGQTVVIEDLLVAEYTGDARRPLEFVRQLETRAILVVPFLRDGRLRTIVYLNDRAPRTWQADDVVFMEELADRKRLVIEREAVEEQLRQLNASLEQRVEARTAELRQTQEALLQSQKMEALGQLVSGMAHDFNNLLSAILGAFELIQHRADDPDRVRRLVETGLRAAGRGSKLTGQLLAFSRAQGIQLQPICVAEVIEPLGDLLERTLGPMILLDLVLDPAPVAVLADPTQVEMMVLNLAINARDAMPDGGTLTIATGVRQVAGDVELSDGEYVEIAVSDTGAGMDEATLRRAMDPFFTTKPVGKGTGLGLAQIYGSARQSGGTVRIESAPGSGTTVRVLLACTDRAPAQGDRAAGAAEGPDGPIAIMIVDDDDDYRMVMANGLESFGHRVLEAADVASALSALEVGTPDVVILDFAMPGGNGAELAAELRRRWPDLPMIFASGFADTRAIEAVAGEGAGILRKPFRIDELLSALRQAVRPA